MANDPNITGWNKDGTPIYRAGYAAPNIPTSTQPVNNPKATPTQPWDYSGGFGNAPATSLDGVNPAWDQTKPGVGETGAAAAGNALMAPSATEGQWDATKGQWNQPTAYEGYWQGVAGKFQGGGPRVSNNAQSAYNAYMQQLPQLSPEANAGAFFDNASQRQAQTMNTQLGARGAFNSSAALDKLAQGEASLRGEEAKFNAQYGLDRANTMANAYGTLGTIGRSADVSSADAARSSLDWLKGGADIAEGASRTTLDRLTGGMEGASAADSAKVDRLTAAATAYLGAQGARDGRIQTAFQNISGLGDKLAGVATDAYTRIIQGDQELMDAALSGKVAAVSEKLNISEADANRLMQDLKAIAEAAVAAGGGGA